MKYFVFYLTAMFAGGAFAQESVLALEPRTAIEDMMRHRLSEAPAPYAEAASAVAAAAKDGDAMSLYALATVSAEPDSPEAVRLGEEERKAAIDRTARFVAGAARGGDILAQYLVAVQTGNRRMMKSAADADYVHALNELGAIRLAETFAKSAPSGADMKTRRECFGYFNRAAAAGDPNGFYNLGVCYLRGWGCMKNAAQAMENLSLAAARAHPKALNLVGSLHEDPVAATRYFAQSAALGNAMGQYKYAKALLEGDGLEQNTARGERMMESAARQGLAEAMDEYGRILYERENADDHAKAVAWWKECAKMHSYAPSIDKFGLARLEGKGVEKDDYAAVRLFLEAARRGNPEAMAHLADCSERGLGGLKKNHYNANWWRTSAMARRGDRNAKVWLSSHHLEK